MQTRNLALRVGESGPCKRGNDFAGCNGRGKLEQARRLASQYADRGTDPAEARIFDQGWNRCQPGQSDVDRQVLPDARICRSQASTGAESKQN